MKTGTVVKYGNDNLGIFLYAHEKNSNDDTLCSVFSKKNNRITYITYRAIELCEDIYLKEDDDIRIYDLDNWYTLKKVKHPDGEDNWWVKLENDRMVYKGEILDIEFEMCVEEFFENGINPILVIDVNDGVVFIYTDYSNIDRANEIINMICDNSEDYDDYDDLNLSEILAMDPSSPRYKVEEDLIYYDNSDIK